MALNNYYDIKLELCELSEEVVKQIRAQLTYLKVSVYKEEARNSIEAKVKSLRLIAKLLYSPTLKDLFEDFVVEKNLVDPNSIDTSCSLTMSVTRLIGSFEQEVAAIKQNSFEMTKSRYDLRKSVRKFREELLAICPDGSRVWTFFQSI